MRFAGRLWQEGQLWLAEVPMLDVMTQGESQEDAYEMLADAIESLVDRPGFKVYVYPGEGDYLEVGASDNASLVALMLRRQRESRGLSLEDVAKELQASSRNTYARYEQGQSVPTVTQLEKLLSAVLHRDIVLSEARAGQERHRSPASP